MLFSDRGAMKDVKDFDAARLWPVINHVPPGGDLANTSSELTSRDTGVRIS